MGKRGPAPKATNLNILEGNLGQRPPNYNEPQPEDGADAQNRTADLMITNQFANSYLPK